eukprot:Partr_v1_DN25195_c0_g1_i4_m76710 putative yip1 interacting factor homolog
MQQNFPQSPPFQQGFASNSQGPSSSSSASSQFPQPHGSYGQPPPSQQQQQYAPPTNYNSPHLSQQHQQQYGQQQHQQQPQQPYGQSQQLYGQPQVGAFLQGAATQLMMDPNAWQSIGAGAFDQGKDLLDKNMNKWINLPVWKYYWTVDNMYVLKKIGLILFPFRHSTWNRLSTRSEVNGQHEAYKEPRYDLNAPDLYIPVMSFLTYILLVGFQSGTESKFKPEVLTITASTAMFCTLCEVIYLRLGIYLLNVNMQDNHIALADLLSYSSYKFVRYLFRFIYMDELDEINQ